MVSILESMFQLSLMMTIWSKDLLHIDTPDYSKLIRIIILYKGIILMRPTYRVIHPSVRVLN